MSYQEVRKLRKKLRQIEHLTFLDRVLTHEELFKGQADVQIETTAAASGADVDHHSDSDIRSDEPFSLPQGTNNSSYSQSENSEDSTMKSVEDETEPILIPIAATGVNQMLPVTKGLDSPAPVSAKRKIDSTKDNTDVLDLTKRTKNTIKSMHKNFFLYPLNGHEDIILCSQLFEKFAFTGSRDTTIRLWDTESLKELHIFGGHTGAVNCLLVMPNNGMLDDIPPGDILLISGSSDCSLRLYSVTQRSFIKSIYVYSAVLKMVWLPNECTLLTATEGGKIEIWSVRTGEVASCFRAFNCPVSAITINGIHVAVAGADGVIRVFTVINSEFRQLFVSENVCPISSNITYTERPPSSMVLLSSGLIYFTDRYPNLKCLNWKTGELSKIQNLALEADGYSDYLLSICDEAMLASSAYNLDTGSLSINVGNLTPDGGYYYVGTIEFPTEYSCRVLSLCAVGSLVSTSSSGDSNRGTFSLLVSGTKLLLCSSKCIDNLHSTNVPGICLYKRADLVKNIVDNSTSEDDSDDDNAIVNEISADNSSASANNSWCNIS